MLSKAQIKHIRSLGTQKYRLEHQQFIAEGDKIVREWLNAAGAISDIVAVEDWAAAHKSDIDRHPEAALHIVPEHILESVSQLQKPNKVLITAAISHHTPDRVTDEWILMLDDIQDPGNMGTLIRIADWFGIRQIICSPGCVDVYNPKVVQSAMGGHLRVQFIERELNTYIDTIGIPVVAATLGGDNIYDAPRLKAAALLIGNESRGVSTQLQAMATHCISIPGKGGAESLNAAVSAGICCALLMPQ